MPLPYSMMIVDTGHNGCWARALSFAIICRGSVCLSDCVNISRQFLHTLLSVFCDVVDGVVMSVGVDNMPLIDDNTRGLTLHYSFSPHPRHAGPVGYVLLALISSFFIHF